MYVCMYVCMYVVWILSWKVCGLKQQVKVFLVFWWVLVMLRKTFNTVTFVLHVLGYVLLIILQCYYTCEYCTWRAVYSASYSANLWNLVFFQLWKVQENSVEMCVWALLFCQCWITVPRFNLIEVFWCTVNVLMDLLKQVVMTGHWKTFTRRSSKYSSSVSAVIDTHSLGRLTGDGS